MTSMIKYKDDIPYTKEMLLHQNNIVFGAACGAAAALLGFFGTGGLAIIPVVGFVVGELLGITFIPGLSTFRHSINQKYRTAHLQQLTDHYINEITMRHNMFNADERWKRFERMREELNSLRRTAEQQNSTLNVRHAEQMEEALVTYLAMWLKRLVVLERKHKPIPEKEIKDRIKVLEKALKTATSPIDIDKYTKAIAKLEKSLTKDENVEASLAAVEANMIMIAQNFDELYQRIMSNPTGISTNDLDDTIAKLRMDEQTQYELDKIDEELSIPAEVGVYR